MLSIVFVTLEDKMTFLSQVDKYRKKKMVKELAQNVQ